MQREQVRIFVLKAASRQRSQEIKEDNHDMQGLHDVSAMQKRVFRKTFPWEQKGLSEVWLFQTYVQVVWSALQPRFIYRAGSEEPPQEWERVALPGMQ